MLALAVLPACLGVRKHADKECQVIHHSFNFFGEIWVYEDEGKSVFIF
ncbi:MAG: Conserved domain protein [Candidatus Midichloria mitochondrii]|uniref:Uncharacterized protein n=1 Tax=Midichloria mitochondrii (strain IricVA) TaxID=696127 RepID=F7XU83_MIDMI|nr:hypothetical protein midi_01166 [Candidatus Midichloria mitochondrii IricVA]